MKGLRTQRLGKLQAYVSVRPGGNLNFLELTGALNLSAIALPSTPKVFNERTISNDIFDPKEK